MERGTKGEKIASENQYFKENYLGWCKAQGKISDVLVELLLLAARHDIFTFPVGQFCSFPKSKLYFLLVFANYSNQCLPAHQNKRNNRVTCVISPKCFRIMIFLRGQYSLNRRIYHVWGFHSEIVLWNQINSVQFT